MSRICVVGSLNIDTVITTSKIPALGETLLGENRFTAHGGKGANQAVAAARLGADTVLIGCVGADSSGAELIAGLRNYGVDIKHVKTVADAATGAAFVVVGGGDNFIIVDSAANSFLDKAAIENCKSAIENCDIVMLQLEIPLETVEYTVEIAKRAGVMVLVDPAPVAALDDALLSKIDILTPNETEGAIIAGFKIKTLKDAKRAVAMILKKGVAQVALTLGEKGVVYNRKDMIVHMPAEIVNAIDTTAAGDTFSGALAVRLAEGAAIDDAVSFAVAAAAITVTRQGAQKSIPDLNEVIGYLKNKCAENKNE